MAHSAGRASPKTEEDDCIKSRVEIHKQDPGVGSCGVQVLEDVVEGQVDCIVYKPVGSVGSKDFRTTELRATGLKQGYYSFEIFFSFCCYLVFQFAFLFQFSFS